MKKINKAISIFVVCGFVIMSAQLARASTHASSASSASSTSTTVAESSTSSTSTTSTVVPAPTASQTAAQYPDRALRFGPYTLLNPPSLPAKSGSGRRVVYKNNLQWAWVVDSQNNVVRALPVSGRRGVPVPGEYKVNSQSLRSYSLDLEDVWFNDMTRFALGPAGGNIGFHAIPTKYGKPLQTEGQLGTFQGSGCLRVTPEDAKFIYNFAKPGTKVVVLP